MYYKKNRVIFTVIITLIMQLFMPMQGVFAKPVTPDSVKLGEMTVQFTDIAIREIAVNSREVGGTVDDPVKTKIGYNIFYYMELNNTSGADLTTSSAIKLQIPKEFVVQATTIPINVDDNGTQVHIANCYVEADGNASLEFLESVKDYGDMSGVFFSIGCVVNEVVVNAAGEQSVDFIIEDSKASLNLYFEPYVPQVVEKLAVVEKSAEIDKNDTTKVWWKITIKDIGTQKLEDVKLVDKLDNEKLEFIGMSDAAKNPIDSTAYSYDSVAGELRYTLPNTLDSSSLPYEVYVETKFSDKLFQTTERTETISVVNEAYLENTKLPKPIISNEAIASTDVKVEWISKTGTPNEIGGITTIDWTVIVNKNNRSIKGAAIFDEIPKGLELMEDTVKIQEVADDTTLTNLGTTPVSADLLDGSNYAYEKVNEIPNGFDGKTNIIGKLRYNFPVDVSDTSYKLTYTTKVVQADIHDSNKEIKFVNYAGLGWGDTYKYFDFTEVSIATNMLSKEGNYNRRNHRITWKVIVNSNKINVTQATVTDNIELGSANPAQKLVPNSIKLDGVPITTGVKYENGILTCELGDIGTNTPVLTFETEVTDANLYAANNGGRRYENVAFFDGEKDGGITLPQSSARGYAYVRSEVINKKGKGYDYITREVTCEIVINQNRMPITTATLEDIIGEGQKYVVDSFELFKYDGASANVLENHEMVGSLHILDEADEKQKLNFTFKDTINEQYTLRFKTKLTEEYANELFASTNTGKKEIKNVAVLLGGDIPTPGVSAYAIQEVKNVVVTKDGRQIGGPNGPIQWEVIVNPNQIELSDATIVDKLANGLDLDINSIILNEINIDKYGNKSLGNEIPLNLTDSIIYDYVENKFEFKLPSPTNNCYRLAFNTDIDARDGASFDNAVTFSGKGMKTWETAQKKQVVVQMTSSGGTASKRPGVINIIKQDATDPMNKKPLEGATFEVVDNLGFVVSRAVTDAQGKAKFTRLKLGVEYSVRETEAPIGYTKGNNEEKVTFDINNKEVTISFDNIATARTLQFKKISDTNEPIQGAEFSLYAKEDTTLVKPLAVAMSSADGQVVFNNITFGEYQLIETKTPNGYRPSTQVYQVNVEKDGRVTLFEDADPAQTSVTEIINSIIKSDIEFKKIDEKLQPLEGATFGLFSTPYTQDLEPIAKTTSDVNGKVLFEDIPYGHYIIREITAPQGYQLNDDIFNADITSVNKVVLPDIINKLKEVITPKSGNPQPSPSKKPDNPQPSLSEEPGNPQPSPSEEPGNSQGSSVEEPDNSQGSSVEEPDNSQGSSVEEPDNSQGSSVEEPDNSQGGSSEKTGNSQSSSSEKPDSSQSEINKETDSSQSEVSKKTDSSQKGDKLVKNKTIDKKKLPQAGKRLDTKSLLVLGLLLIGIGYLVNAKSKKYD